MKQSAWPAGFYYLPKSVEGCPDPPWKYGWREGRVYMTFVSPVTYEQCINNDEVWQSMFSHEAQYVNLMGPFSEQGLQMNFCGRVDGYLEYDNIAWPPGNYSIYKKNGTDCPNGKQWLKSVLFQSTILALLHVVRIFSYFLDFFHVSSLTVSLIV